MLCFHNKPSDGCHLVREIVVSEGEVEPADQRQPQQGGHLHPVLASSTHPRNGGRRLTEISRVVYVSAEWVSGHIDIITSQSQSPILTDNCSLLVPDSSSPPSHYSRQAPGWWGARILRLEHESCKELPWDQRLLPSSRLPSFIHPLLAAIPSPATTTYQ